MAGQREVPAMEFLIRVGCPVGLSCPWQVALFLAIPCLMAALGARLLQGSALRIVGAATCAMLRDGIILAIVTFGHPACNPHYNPFASLLLIYLTAAGAALGATLGPYRGRYLWILAALGPVAGQLLFEPLARELLALALGGMLLRSLPRRSAVPPC